jgi:hypothetical protein
MQTRLSNRVSDVMRVEVVWNYFGSDPRVSAMTKASKTRPHLAAPSLAQPLHVGPWCSASSAHSSDDDPSYTFSRH